MCKAKEEPEEDDLLVERKMKIEQTPSFFWEFNEEPHMTRRLEIVKKYPEIKQLFGPDTRMKYKVIFWVFFQIACLTILQGQPWYIWVYCCYTLSGSVNHMLTLAMHELSHNLGSKLILSNRLLAILANIPMGIPAAASFKRYHMEHHRYQGEEVIDVDIPTDWEGKFFTSAPKKMLWCFLQPLFYSLRPMVVNPKEPTKWEVINLLCCVVFDILIFHLFGVAGLLYLVFGTMFGMGLHPVAGHFIAEHYVMNQGQETYSYYGPLNWLTFHVGYHNEHHDFPFVSGTKLAQVRRIAPEFYDDIPHYHSWIKVIYDYIFDSKISPYSRTKRVTMTNHEIQKLRARGGLVK